MKSISKFFKNYLAVFLLFLLLVSVLESVSAMEPGQAVSAASGGPASIIIGGVVLLGLVMGYAALLAKNGHHERCSHCNCTREEQEACHRHKESGEEVK